jgi:hypothetical protein
MGSNQNLIIILAGTIIFAIVVGWILLAPSGYDEGIKDIALKKVNDLGALSNEYYKTPLALKGGGNSYRGFEIPENFRNSNSGFSYKIETHKNIILLQLVSRKDNYNGEPYKFMAYYTPDGLLTFFLYEPDEIKWVKLYDRRWPNFDD